MMNTEIAPLQTDRMIQQLHGVFCFSRSLDGVFHYVSSAVFDVLGYSEAEFQCHFNTYLTDDPDNQLVECYRSLSCKGVKQAPYEVSFYHKNRDVKCLMVSEMPRFDERGTLVAVDGLALDVTGQKQCYGQILTNLQDEREYFKSKVMVQQQTLKQTNRIRKLWKGTQRCFEQENKRYHAIISNSFDAHIVSDESGNIKEVNSAVSKIFGWQTRELLKKKIHEILPSFHCNVACGDCFNQLHERIGVHKDAHRLFLEVALSMIVLKDETFLSMTIRDVSDKKETEALIQEHQHRLESRVAQRTAQLKHANDDLLALANKMESLNCLDELTGIYNRRGFDQEYHKEWCRAQRSQSSIVVIMIDIDHFKLFNDSYGHPAGDLCLKKVAATLANTVHRTDDLVCRYGGEEFVIVLPDTTDKGALHVAECFRAAIEDLHVEHQISPVSDYVTISLGVAVCVPSAEMQLKYLLKAADDALYEAKEVRNSVVLSVLS